VLKDSRSSLLASTILFFLPLLAGDFSPSLFFCPSALLDEASFGHWNSRRILVLKVICPVLLALPRRTSLRQSVFPRFFDTLVSPPPLPGTKYPAWRRIPSCVHYLRPLVSLFHRSQPPPPHPVFRFYTPKPRVLVFSTYRHPLCRRRPSEDGPPSHPSSFRFFGE